MNNLKLLFFKTGSLCAEDVSPRRYASITAAKEHDGVNGAGSKRCPLLHIDIEYHPGNIVEK